MAFLNLSRCPFGIELYVSITYLSSCHCFLLFIAFRSSFDLCARLGIVVHMCLKQQLHFAQV